MPLTVYDAAATAALLKTLDPDLAFLFDELKLDEKIQANIAGRRIVKLGVFAKLEPTEEAFRAWATTDLGLDPDQDLDARVTIAQLVDARDSARQRVATTQRLEAEARVTGQNRELMKGTHLSLRRAAAAVVGQLDDRRCPGRAYVEARLEQIDDGELEAEPLTKVTTVSSEQESVESSTGPGLNIRKDGVLHVVKGRRSVPMPRDPEQLRQTLRVMALHWLMVHLKGSGRTYLHDFTIEEFSKHADYLLGDEVQLIKEANPAMPVGPSWDLLLIYELELRKFAVRLVNEKGRTLVAALREARESVDHRSKFFVAPLAMQRPGQGNSGAASGGPRGAKRPHEPEVPGGASDPSGAGGSSSQAPHQPPSGKGKAKGKGKRLSIQDLRKMNPKKAYRLMRNSAEVYGLANRSKDKQALCHHFQSGSCVKDKCDFTHACMRCGGNHGCVSCPELR